MSSQSYECRFKCDCVNQSSSPRELSQCPHPFQEHFIKAWQACERHDYESLKQSVSKIKAVASTEGVLTPLDVFRVLGGSRMVYTMTLMAFCGVNGRKEMVQLLLDEGAKIDTGCDRCGAPLLQMIFHCFVQNVEIDTTVVQYFIEKGSPLSRVIVNREVDGQGAQPGYRWSMLDLPLTMTTVNGFEVAKVLVEFGEVDPITGGTPDGEAFIVVPMFQEYCFIGTNNYIRWLCEKHIPNDKRGEFVDRVFECITSMKNNPRFTTWNYERRTPSHAILTSQHQETITQLVQKGEEQDEDFLAETNSTGKTALHMAAENGDLESVKILLQLGADATACDNSDLNPFMLALGKGHKAVAEFMLEKGANCLGPGGEAIEWALENNITLFFQLLGEVDPHVLLTPLTDAGANTIVHLVAAAGNTEMFKIILDKIWSEEGMQQVVERCNAEGKTALQLGVEKECIDILKAVEEWLEKPGPPIKWQSALRDKWRSEVIPPLFCHASSCGSLTAVKYFINNGYQPTMSHRDCQGDTTTPLLCASGAGHDDIVAHLLQYRAVSSNSENLKLPLLRAAFNGHAKCVTLLLEKEASVLERDETGKNCLVLAIENQHKETALAILSDTKQGLDALKCVESEKETTPLRLLIKEMPELAEYVLNRSVGSIDMTDSGEPVRSPRGFQSQSSITYDFQLLDDLQPEGASEDDQAPLINVNRVQADCGLEETIALSSLPRNYPPKMMHLDTRLEGRASATDQYKLKYRSDNHILKWMTRYKRLELLQHPLVKEYLFHKFWLVTFPHYLGYLLLYCVFLILLTSFALVSPRPGPDSDTCPEGNPHITTNGTNCTGQSGVERGFLAGAAGLVLLLCCLLLFIEGVQLYRRRSKYFTEFDNYFQVTLFVVTITFVAPGFANDCWCAHNWQWQIGALALCLGWVNFIILLKDLPWTAIPINIFVNICITFLKVLFLPFLLLMAFALPFYMVFVRTFSASEEMDVPALAPFTSPGLAIAKTMVLMIGEIDFNKLFNEGNLLYNPMTYILFVIFLIIVPVLFINLLIGLAVGDANEEKEKAQFTKIKVRVDFILERERNSKHRFTRFLARLTNSTFLQETYRKRAAQFDESGDFFDPEGFCGKLRFTRFLAQLFGLEYKRHFKIVKQMEERNKAIFCEVMGISDSEAVKTTLQQESDNILHLKEEIKAQESKGISDSDAVKAALQQESERILQLKEEIKAETKKELSAVKAALQQESEEILHLLKALTEKVEALGDDRNTLTTT